MTRSLVGAVERKPPAPSGRLSAEQRDTIVAALPFAVALMESLPAHLVPRAFLVSDSIDLFEQLGGDERLLARSRRAVSKHLQPVKVSVSTL